MTFGLDILHTQSAHIADIIILNGRTNIFAPIKSGTAAKIKVQTELIFNTNSEQHI